MSHPPKACHQGEFCTVKHVMLQLPVHNEEGQVPRAHVLFTRSLLIRVLQLAPLDTYVQVVHCMKESRVQP